MMLRRLPWYLCIALAALLALACVYAHIQTTRLDSAQNEADRLVFEMPRHDIGLPAAKEVSAREVRKAFKREAPEPLRSFAKEVGAKPLGVGTADFAPPSKCPEIKTAHLKTFPLLSNKGKALSIAHDLSIEYTDGATEQLQMTGGTLVYHLPENVAHGGARGLLSRITAGIEATALTTDDWKIRSPVSAHAGVRLGGRFNTKLEAVVRHDTETEISYGIRLSANWN